MAPKNSRPRPQPPSVPSSASPVPQSQPQIVKLTPTARPGEDPAAPAGGREWWAQRWIDVLESFGWRRRLERARNYVREGKILNLDFQGPEVVARVQGTAPEPYNVSLAIDPFSDEQWDYAIEEMSRRAIFAAKLLAGEMPQAIEEAFTASGLSLFPFSKFDIHSHCSCPDPINPCKHIGAVYYLLGDYFSRDPFILFQLRGRTKQQIITALRQMRSSNGPAPGIEPETRPPQAPPLPAYLEPQFWQYDDQLDASLVVIAPPPSPETVLDVLGPIPLESGPAAGSWTATTHQGTTHQGLMERLARVYQQVSQQALVTAMTTGEGS